MLRRVTFRIQMGSETKVKIDDPIDTRRPFFRTGWADVEAGLISSIIYQNVIIIVRECNL